MALTESQIEALGDKYLVGLYQEMERDVIQDIARRVRKTDRWTETAEIMARNMKEMGYSTSKIYSEVMRVLQADPEYVAQVAENTKEYKAMVTEIIKETTAEARAAGNELVAQAGMMAYNNDLSMWEQAGQDLSEPNQLSQIVSSFQKDLDGELRNLTRTTGFKGTILGTTGVKQAYQRALDVSMLEVASGNFSYDAAVDRVVKQLAQSGLRKIDYASGRSYQLDTAARMCVRTSVNQMAGRITEANAQSTDTDLVIVTEHEGARPEHVPCERQVYSLSGKSKKYPDFRAALGKGAGYGTAEGICGPNCRHTFYPFWPGISKIPDPLPKHDPFKYKGKTYDYYEATQKQRSMERQIRSLKREEYVARTDEDRAAIQRQIRAKTKEYHDFSDAAGIRPKDNRLRVVGSTATTRTKGPDLRDNSSSPIFGGVVDELQSAKVRFLEAKPLAKPLSESEIIKKVAGVDMTKGSCNSLALAYLGNKAGYDVRDFRGGASLEVFSSRDGMTHLASVCGGIVDEGYDEVALALNTISQIETGKEYYFAAGEHGAIVRKNGVRYEYLELQATASIPAGFKELTSGTLETRFGCKKKDLDKNGRPKKSDCILIDADSIINLEGFSEMLGYINTTNIMQKKWRIFNAE